MILPIYTYGNAVLRKEAQDITPDYPELQTLIANMFETMDASDGIGLAAPQVGLDIRVVVIDIDVLSEDYPEYKGFRRAYINPHILEYDENSEKKSMEEGCLSLPGIHENVKRPTRIHVRYQDEKLRRTRRMGGRLLGSRDAARVRPSGGYSVRRPYIADAQTDDSR